MDLMQEECSKEMADHWNNMEIKRKKVKEGKRETKEMKEEAMKSVIDIIWYDIDRILISWYVI